jgi:hypothetical protein
MLYYPTLSHNHIIMDCHLQICLTMSSLNDLWCQISLAYKHKASEYNYPLVHI